MCPYPHLDEDAVAKIKSSDARRKELEKEKSSGQYEDRDAPHLAIKRGRRSGEITVLVLIEVSRPCTARTSGLDGETTLVVERLLL